MSVEESENKELFNPDCDSEVLDHLQSITNCSADPVKLFSLGHSDLLAANNNFICIGSGKSLQVTKSMNTDNKFFSFQANIVLLEICKSADILSVHLENHGFLIFDLETEKEIFEYTQQQSISFMK